MKNDGLIKITVFVAVCAISLLNDMLNFEQKVAVKNKFCHYFYFSELLVWKLNFNSLTGIKCTCSARLMSRNPFEGPLLFYGRLKALHYVVMIVSWNIKLPTRSLQCQAPGLIHLTSYLIYY